MPRESIDTRIITALATFAPGELSAVGINNLTRAGMHRIIPAIRRMAKQGAIIRNQYPVGGIIYTLPAQPAKALHT